MNIKRILTPLLIILLLFSIVVMGAPTYVNLGPTSEITGDVGVPDGSGYYINDILFSTLGLIDISTLAKTDGGIIVGDGTNFVLETGDTARASLGLTIGTHVQAYDAGLLNLAGLTYASDSFIKVTAEDVYAIRTIAETKTDLSLNNVENLKVKLDATQAPTVNDDVDLGYSVGSSWVDITNDKGYICLDNTDGAAVWIEVTLAGSGYTNLTSFVDQTAWRVFYSNNLGDVIELALGTDGQYLKSTGATSAPIFDTPAGAGDMLKATYDTDTDGDIDVASGGTEKSSWTLYAIPYLSGTTAFGEIPIGTAEYVLTVNAGATGYDFTVLAYNSLAGNPSNRITAGDNLTWSTDTLNVDDSFLLNTGDIGTGIYDFGGATSFEIPNSATPSLTVAGQLAYDTTVTGLTNGCLSYYGGDIRYLIDLDTLPVDNGYVPTYNATLDKFEMAAGGGAGEANTASNIGGEAEIFKQKTGVDLELRTLKAGSNKITVSHISPGDSIDVGPEAKIRSSGRTVRTSADKNNPANATGIINYIEIYARDTLSDCIIATFYVVSGNYLSTRDSVTIGSVASGAKRTFTKDSESNPIALEVQAGDYLGIYYSAGTAEYDTTGYVACWSADGNVIPADNVLFDYFAGHAISIYATGVPGYEDFVKFDIVPLEIAKEVGGLLSITTVSFAADGDTTLYTVPTGKRCVLTYAIVVAADDAGATTTVSIGANGAETDFVPANTLSNLDTQYDSVILQPIPNTTPLKIKSYAAATVIQAQVASQSGVAGNTIYLFGITY